MRAFWASCNHYFLQAKSLNTTTTTTVTMASTKVSQLMVCLHCKYAWTTRTKLENVTCPNCLKKANVKEYKDTFGGVKK